MNETSSHTVDYMSSTGGKIELKRYIMDESIIHSLLFTHKCSINPHRM
jgi:hypothetical protein